jgi:hypothetical protein
MGSINRKTEVQAFPGIKVRHYWKKKKKTETKRAMWLKW